MLRLALVALGITAASPAWALSCAWGPNFTVPEDGAEGVPLNARIYVGVWGNATPDDFPVHLFDQGTGEAVEIDVSEVEADNDGAPVWVVTPRQELEPGTVYAVYLRDVDAESLDIIEPGAAFTTGDARDEEAPAAPEVVSADREGGVGMWGRWRWNNLVMDHDEPGIFLVDVSSSRDFSEFRTIATLGTPSDLGEVETSVGWGVCGGNLDISRSDRHMRVRAMDLAGNLSELDAEAAGVRAGGCSSTGAPALGVGVLLALGLIGLRRRKEA